MAVLSPTPEQELIYDEFDRAEDNIIVEAVAGSGKTTTILGIAERARGQKVLIIAFNKAIADELTSRLPKTPVSFGMGGASSGASARTIHSVGKQVLEIKFGMCNVNGNKYRDIVRDYVRSMNLPYKRQQEAMTTLRELISLFRLALVRPTDEEGLMKLVAHHNMDFPEMVFHVNKVFEIGMDRFYKEKIIDFDDMVFLPIYLGLEFPKYDKVLVDECQDLNRIQLKTAMKLVDKDGQLGAVGDRRQAIYGFAGADADSFHNIEVKTEAKVMDLSVCFRCPTSHIELAKKIVPQIQPRDNAPYGTILSFECDTKEDWVFWFKTLKSGDLVLCRLNAPLIKICVQAMRLGIKTRIRGVDLAYKLTSIFKKVEKLHGFSYNRIKDYLEVWKEQQMGKLRQAGAYESAVNYLRDMVETAHACVDEFPEVTYVEDLSRKIAKLFEDTEDAIWLSSVHRAKGLEAETVYILHPELLPLNFKDQQEWEKVQEENLLYVALTRSKHTLGFVSKAKSIEEN